MTDHSPRYHLRLGSPAGALFGWYSIDRRGREVLRHELAVRQALGSEGELRAPPVIAHGVNWRVERMLESEPLSGRPALERVTEAGIQIARTSLPERNPSSRTRREVAARTRRRGATLALLARSPLPLRDWWLARQFVRDSTLPRVVSHGSFIPVHLFLSDGAVYVIDWEELGERPVGWDLMQLWAALPSHTDRSTLMELVMGALGPDVTRNLMRMRYAALVARIVSKVAEDPQFGERDASGAKELLTLLPQVRDAALSSS